MQVVKEGWLFERVISQFQPYWTFTLLSAKRKNNDFLHLASLLDKILAALHPNVFVGLKILSCAVSVPY
jgi:hypothetical protein